ncbi:MAG TPA: signal peptidase II [Fimbriimonadaceae bacterium]|nr:signal peptidase II [Fimbriimonadaceae bacterium]
MTRRLFFLVAASMLFIDQFVKAWVRFAANGAEGRTIFVLWPRVFEIKLVFNEGIAFGMLQGSGVLLAPIAAIIGIGAAWYSMRHKDESKATHVTMALLCAGAIGNLIDRVVFNHVTDMFWISAINFPVFNVADVCITVAGVMLGLSVVIDLVKRPAPKESDPDPIVPE